MGAWTAGLAAPLTPPVGFAGTAGSGGSDFSGDAGSGGSDFSGDSGSTGGGWTEAVETREPSRPDENPCAIHGYDRAPTMVVIPPGRFLMGSPDGEPDRTADEGPQHWVTIPRPFAISRCETTVGQFGRFVQATGYVTSAEKPDSAGCYVWDTEKKTGVQKKGANWRNPGYVQDPRHPVVCVSHVDALAYAEWLSKRTGAVYRLPTEAEWEYVARATTETPYYWGDDKDHKDQCAFANGSGSEVKAIADKDWTLADCQDAFVYTAPVASFKPNPFGLYDLSGNVWEWTADCWHDGYQKAPKDGTAWQEANGGDCKRRVVRGGSWSGNPQGLRSANRYSRSADDAGFYQGFRLARAL